MRIILHDLLDAFRGVLVWKFEVFEDEDDDGQE